VLQKNQVRTKLGTKGPREKWHMLQEDGGMGLLCGWGISLPKPYGVHIRGGGGGVTKLFDTSGCFHLNARWLEPPPLFVVVKRRVSGFDLSVRPGRLAFPRVAL
jgi:hypothetical protein